MAIEYEEIRKATRNFQPNCILGEGSSSLVYKGCIDENYLASTKPESGIAVAVKKMKYQGSEEYKEWVDQISHLRHANLVMPIGYSFGTDQRILVYEFMPKGSLYIHLFVRRQPPLDWATRIKVAVGAARCLAFLHSLEKPVLCRILSSRNILLDGDFNAKLSDVGLPNEVFGHVTETPNKEVFGHETEQYTAVFQRETGSPYAAPEYIATGRLYIKSDVYSFGVVLGELMSGRRAIGGNWATGKHKLMDCAISHLGIRRSVSRIMDIRLEGQYPREKAYKVWMLAFQCVTSNPKSRPTMAEVVAALQQI